MKKLSAIFIITTIIVTAISKLWVSEAKTNEIHHLNNYNDIIIACENFPVYSLNAETEDYGEVLLNSENDILEKLSGDSMLSHSEVNVLIVRAKDDFTQYSQSYTQTAIVKEVVSGNNSITNQEILIANYFGITKQENNQFIFWGTKGRNIMIPKNEYLIFCEKAEISDYETKPVYRILPTTFSCLNVSSDYSKIIDINNNVYKEYVGSEFLVNNEKTLNAVLKIKHDILDIYYPQNDNL